MIALRFAPDIPIPAAYFFKLVFDDAIFFILLSLFFGLLLYSKQSRKKTFNLNEKGEALALKKYSYLQITIAFLITLLFLWLPFFKLLGLNDF